MSSGTLKISAPAKINLYLHVTGKRNDGYHLLESLICFSDLEDKIVITPADKMSLHVTGEFSKDLAECESDNLIFKALKALENYSDTSLNYKIELEKNIPLGAGLGGGSGNAAAVIRSVTKALALSISSDDLEGLLLLLGADVPVCYYNAPCIISGIGENIHPIILPKKMHGVLVNPKAHCSTQEIFNFFNGEFTEKNATSFDVSKNKNLVEFLKSQKNDLEKPAMQAHAVINEVLKEISAQDNCSLARMSGSGSTCFGLFEDEQAAQVASDKISIANPDWWVRKTIFN